MVALCSGSSASSPVESSPSLDIIIEDQQQHFLRLAFGTNMMDLLNNMLLNSFNRGNFAVIEQLWCWQDPNECPHSLSLLLGELRSTRHFSVAVAVVRLLARLFRLASDQVTKQRLRNQMEALRFDDAVLSLRNRFRLYSLTTDSAAVPSSFGVLLEEAIEDWMMMMMHAKAEENGEDATTSRTDADSGTFSGDEEESKQQQQQQQLMVTGGKKEDEHKDGQLDAVVRLIHTLPAHEVPLLAQLLRTFAASNRSLITLISSIPLDNRLQSRQCGAGTPPPLASPLLSPASVCPRSSSFPPAPPPPPPVSLVRPPPPPLSSPSTCRGHNQQTADIPSALRPKVLPDQCRRLRHLQWTKLPTNAIAASAASANVWQTMEAVDQEMRDHLDFTVLDAFFGCPSNTPQNISDISCRSAPSSARRRSSMMLNGGDCVTLLDSKRSLSVNVFLKMCRDSDQLLKDLADGKADKIGADRLRTISHLLPSAEEQKILRDFSGDKQMLGAAEQFLLALTERIPAHRLRLEAMLFKLDLEGMLDTNRPNDGGLGLKVWLNGCQELLSSGTLRKVLYALLHLGNYLNHGAGSGNAVGFRLSSLWKVEDVKTIGGTRGRTLLHFVAQQVGNCAQALATELANVRESAKSSLEAISDDVRGLLERMHCLEEGISRTIFVSNAGGDAFLEDFLNFLKKSRHIIALAERQLAELSTLRRSVATFLCEQEQNFSLEECFKVIAWFITRFEKAVEENRRFVERDQQQMDAAQQFRKLPESFNGMALKCVVKRTRQESGRQSFALVDERERQQQTPCGSSSPGKVRRRRTAHSVTPLLDGRQFLNGLEECNERMGVNEVAEESLEAVVDQALMRRVETNDREVKNAKTFEEENGEEKQTRMAQKEANLVKETAKNVAKLSTQQMMPKEAKLTTQKMVPKDAKLTTQQMVPKEGKVVHKTIPSALVTMSMKAKTHFHRSAEDKFLKRKSVDGNTEEVGLQQPRGMPGVQAVSERIGLVGSATDTNNKITITLKPSNLSRVPVYAQRALPTAVSKCAESSAPKGPPAVCRIRTVVKPNNGQMSSEQTTPRQTQLSERPLRPSQVKASQQKVQQIGIGTKTTAVLKTTKSMATTESDGFTVAKTKSSCGGKATATTMTTTSNKKNTTGAAATASSSVWLPMRAAAAATKNQMQQQQQHQKDKIVAPQQQQLGKAKPSLIRRLSTSSRPTLVHSVGRSGTGNRERGVMEKPKWI